MSRVPAHMREHAIVLLQGGMRTADVARAINCNVRNLPLRELTAPPRMRRASPLARSVLKRLTSRTKGMSYPGSFSP
ncbi:hypothetical protein QQF64_005777 [Cirrhinus molitorella]|uniref:Transposase n=1 Tax=Cirrhinus molitorella TaxID=172907 RepID=A0ABR3MD61_9TELE